MTSWPLVESVDELIMHVLHVLPKEGKARLRMRAACQQRKEDASAIVAFAGRHIANLVLALLLCPVSAWGLGT